MTRLKKNFNAVDLKSGKWPWFLLILLGFSNALLSYAPLPLVGRLWMGLFGVLVPLGLAFYLSGRSETSPSPVLGKDWLPPLPWALAAALVAGMAALRVFNPLRFIPWPLYDEAINGYYALRLDRQWTWSPFFFYSQLPPLFIWLLCFLYKVTGSFLAAIRWEPILISILILPAAYAAARAFFSRSFSLLYLLLVGFGFWALFFGRISHQGVLLVLWEYLAVAVLGKALKAGGPARRPWLLLLGFLLGTGFYTYFSWPLVALWIIVIALVGTGGPKISPKFLNLGFKNNRKLKIQDSESRIGLLCLFLPLLACLSPILLALLQHRYGSYFQFLWTLHTRDSGVTQLQAASFCLSSFLWGNGPGDFHYSPIWGGFFNPVSGGCLLLGALELFRRRNRPEARAILGALPLFLLPAFVTNSPTDMREIQVLPILSLLAAWGLGALVENFPAGKKLLALGMVLALSTSLDSVHLLRFGDYARLSGNNQKTAENSTAFGILDSLQAREGPGLILTAYSNDVYTYDQSLMVSTYPFNALLNPRLFPDAARWLAVVTNVHFQPFLAREFPEAKMAWLSQEGGTARDNFNGGLMLVSIPLTPRTRPLLKDWVETDGLFRDMSARVMNLPLAEARRETLRVLSASLPSLSRDRFIRSCYWEAVYFNYNWENLYGDRDSRVNFPAAVQALQRAVEEGYPTAYFYNELGSCYALAGEDAKARWAFGKAIRSPLDLTPAADNLKALDTLEKPGSSKAPPP